MTKTPNYSLPQWERTDQVKMSDFNDAFSAIDQKCGNLRVITGTYTGTGKYGTGNPNKLTFDEKPLIVLIQGDGFILTTYGAEKANALSTGVAAVTIVFLTWSDHSMTWYSSNDLAHQLNTKDFTYRYYFFYAT